MNSARQPALGLRRAAAPTGALRLPPSKSIAQRCLLAAGLARGTTRLAGLAEPHGEDVHAALGVLTARNVPCSRSADGLVHVSGQPPYGAGASEVRLEVGESGTLARLCLATAALAAPAGTRSEFVVRGSLARRSSPALLAALPANHLELAGGAWPNAVRAQSTKASLRLEGPGSSQEVSALLLALAAQPRAGKLEVIGAIPSRPYVDLTLDCLERFGVDVEERELDGNTVFTTHGPLHAPADELWVEPDASAAAVGLAAACLTGGELRVEGLGANSPQGDVAVLEHLRALGCRAGSGELELHAGGEPQRAVDLDLERAPDLAPVLAIVAAAATGSGGESTLRGLRTLPGKESSRIAVLAGGLDAAGWSVRASADSLWIGGRERHDEAPLVLDPEGDHRMAFAFALLGLLRPNTYVRNPACVAKSWPRFWEDLAASGFQVVRRAGI